MSAPQPCWSPTAEDFTRHQLSQVTNFWRQGRAAEFRLKALPSGHAELCLTFELPSPSDSIPPPIVSAQFPPPRKSFFSRGSVSDQRTSTQSDPKPKPASPFVSSRRRKSYRRSVLHRAGLAASSLPPPKCGSLRQAASACVQRLQAEPAKSERKRPLPASPSVQSPLAQRIREDIQISQIEVDSPERELLRGQTSPEKSPPSSFPCVKAFPLPAPLVFTPLKIPVDVEIPTSNVSEVVESIEEVVTVEVEMSEKLKKEPKQDLTPRCCNCDAAMTLDHQCETSDSDSNWEDIESEENSYPTLDLNSEDWAEKFTDSIRSFHGSNP